MLLPEWSDVPKPLIGMLHLPPLPGAPGFRGEMRECLRFVLDDAGSLVAGGVQGLMLENFGDAPFFPGSVPAHTVAAMTAVAAEVRRRFDVPLGINVLRNDGSSALAIARAVGARFIRVNILCGARLTDQGVIAGIAHQLLRDRKLLGAEEIRIFADVNVKHSAPLAPRPLEEEIEEMLHRGGADALVVTGTATGRGPALEELRAVKAAAGATPVLAGSGVSPETIAALLPYADGFIAGTSLKQDGVVGNPVDRERVRTLLERLG